MKVLKIASRKSALARLQSYTVAEAIQRKIPSIQIEYFFSESLGDKNLHDPLWKMPEKGVFTSDFTDGLIQKKYDLVVHSWKDLPIEENLQTEIFATLDREPPYDLLLTNKNKKASETKNPKILSSSPRREYNLKEFLMKFLYPQANEVQFLPVRGNIQTRIQKLFDQDADGLVVAFAAIKRLLNFEETSQEILKHLSQLNLCLMPLTVNPPAAAQGALAVEILKDNLEAKEVLNQINNTKIFKLVNQERLELKKYGGGCHQKIGVYFTDIKGQQLKILKGFTKNQEKLDLIELEGKNTSINLRKLWSESKSAFKLFNKNPVPFSYDHWLSEITKHQNTELMISHPFLLEISEVLTFIEKVSSVGNIFFTTSSLSVWKKMNDLGFFIYATSESLGLKIEHVCSNVKRFKLSHSAAHDISQNYTLIPCYQLTAVTLSIKEQKDLELDLLSSDGYFWTSFTQFKYIVNQCPQIVDRHHFCGPGLTFDNIKHHLENVIGHSNNLCSYLNEQSWLHSQTQGDL
jgi:hydroxymethylbilane synthase